MHLPSLGARDVRDQMRHPVLLLHRSCHMTKVRRWVGGKTLGNPEQRRHEDGGRRPAQDAPQKEGGRDAQRAQRDWVVLVLVLVLVCGPAAPTAALAGCLCCKEQKPVLVTRRAVKPIHRSHHGQVADDPAGQQTNVTLLIARLRSVIEAARPLISVSMR